MSLTAHDGSSLFSLRKEYVPLFDKIEGELPESKNWFEEGFVGTPMDQFSAGQCASAWAFSTVSTLQAGAAINGGFDKTELSVQQLIDCDTANNGC